MQRASPLICFEVLSNTHARTATKVLPVRERFRAPCPAESAAA
jgi:hypothetical protein